VVTRPSPPPWGVAVARLVGVPVRLVVLIVLLLTLLVPPVALGLDLPVRDLRHEAVSGPSYVADRIEVRLMPAAAARARAARATGAAVADADVARARLGLAALDAAAAELGVWFETEFRGETPPPSGSADADFTAFYIAHLPEGTDLEGALARLGGLADVQSAQPIAVLPVSAAPNDSLWSTSWWFDQPSGCSIHAPPAWDFTAGDTSIVVAILDTGVIPYHPDLGGMVAGQAGQIWTNWVEQGGVPGVDDDGNGFVDDTWGWDFVNLPTSTNVLPVTRLAPFEDWRDQDNDPNDYSGHGTMVAGLVGALTDNGIGVAGVAWRVRLMPLRIGWSENANLLGTGYMDMSFAAQAVRYATRMRADVINCSFASLNQSGLGVALDAAIRAGVTVVAAAGNNPAPGYVDSYIGMREDVIAVAATNASDQVATSSTRGSWVDLAAPGVGLFSSFITRAALASDSLTYRKPAYNASAPLNGTSFSAPLVAGAAALLQARQKALGLRPLLPRGVQLRLRETADDISSVNTGTGYGTGRLNLERALNDRPTSTAWRAAGKSVGPAVPIPLSGPTRKLAWVMNTPQLLIQDWLTGDTLALVTLPGVPARQLAGADLGGGYGVGLFVGTENGWLAGFDTTGAALPGFPVSPGGASSLAGGPALGDLDGDDELEIVCGAGDGRLCAWHLDGSVVAGFPVETGASGFGAPVALTDLDGRPGVEIIAATQDGVVHAVNGDGAFLPGWPVTFAPGPQAPVVTCFGRDTVVLVAAGTQLIGLRPDGSERSRWTLGAYVVNDPALGDLDGDGSDEIVLPASAPNRVIVLDSAGVAPIGRNWPFALTAAPLGPPVLGHLSDGGAPRVVLMQTGGLVALTDSAKAMAVLPKPGGAGTYPTLADLTGDGAMKIAAGSGSDSLLYVYDVGAGSAAALPQAWPTPRGNFARTGSRLYRLPDTVPPATVSDLAVEFSAPDSVRLSWTAPGDDGGTGRAAAYDLRFTTSRSSIGSMDAGTTRLAAPAPGTAGASEGVTVPAVEPGVTCWYWLRTNDEAGNTSGCSNIVEFTRSLDPAIPDGLTLAVRRRPSPVPVLLDWSGATVADIRLYDVSGRLVRTLRLARGGHGTEEWDGRDESGRLVPAGLYFARLTGGSRHAQSRIVLLP
jgi:subtilisin family serine protease